MKEWTKKLSVAHEAVVLAVLGLPCSSEGDLFESARKLFINSTRIFLEVFQGLLASSVAALKAEDVVIAPYGPRAEACCIQIVHAIYSAVESCLTALVTRAKGPS